MSSRETGGEDVETVVTAVSRTQSKVTLNELLDTLRLLEEEPELLPPPKLFKKDRYAWVDRVSRGLRLVMSTLRQRRLPGESRFSYGLPSPSACWVVEGEKRSWFTAREVSGGVCCSQGLGICKEEQNRARAVAGVGLA